MIRNILLSLAVAFSTTAWISAPAATIAFTDQTAFDSQFPAATRYFNGSLSTATLESNRLKLYALAASTDTNLSARVFTYSTTDPAYNFVSAAKTFTFNGAALTYPASGSTFTGYAGIFGENGAAVGATGGPSDGIYFSIDRNTNTLTLNLRLDAANTVLTTFTGAGFAFDSLSFTVSGTSWTASYLKSDGVGTATANGTFATAITASNWGSNYYLGAGVYQSSTATSGRWAQFGLDSIDVSAVPEPSSLALLFGGAGLMLAGRFRGRPQTARP